MRILYVNRRLKNICIFFLIVGIIYFVVRILKLKVQEPLSPTIANPDKDGKLLPILILAHNRDIPLRNLLVSLRKICDPVLNPIIVSIDSDHAPTHHVATRYSDLVLHMQNNTVPKNAIKKFAGYYLIASHYRWAFNHVFPKYEYVLILEDDMETSTDFLQYFDRFLDLLISDPTLLCVSAWNDNGFDERIDISDPMLVHRTDVFPGLGWILTRSLWDELKNKWPEGFWDDWLRQPAQRRNRSCIRPEKSRTGISVWGHKGVSQGEFYLQHIRRVKPYNGVIPDWKNFSLENFKLPTYDVLLLNRIRECKYIELHSFSLTALSHINHDCIRMTYKSERDYVLIAKVLGLMSDFKSGQPRTAYKGIVQTFANSKRIFIHTPNVEQLLN